MACESGVVYSNNMSASDAKNGITMWNTPNPFNPTTTISFNLPQSELVNLTIYNLMGQKVTTLLDRPLGAGEHSVAWNGSNVASGVYFYVLDVGTATMTQKMLLLK